MVLKVSIPCRTFCWRGRSCLQSWLCRLLCCSFLLLAFTGDSQVKVSENRCIATAEYFGRFQMCCWFARFQVLCVWCISCRFFFFFFQYNSPTINLNVHSPKAALTQTAHAGWVVPILHLDFDHRVPRLLTATRSRCGSGHCLAHCWVSQPSSGNRFTVHKFSPPFIFNPYLCM